MPKNMAEAGAVRRPVGDHLNGAIIFAERTTRRGRGYTLKLLFADGRLSELARTPSFDMARAVAEALHGDSPCIALRVHA